MPISDSTAASYSNYNVRSELASNAIKQANQQEQDVADRLEQASQSNNAQETQRDRREQRQIPGLGEAVDITA